MSQNKMQVDQDGQSQGDQQNEDNSSSSKVSSAACIRQSWYETDTNSSVDCFFVFFMNQLVMWSTYVSTVQDDILKYLVLSKIQRYSV